MWKQRGRQSVVTKWSNHKTDCDGNRDMGLEGSVTSNSISQSSVTACDCLSASALSSGVHHHWSRLSNFSAKCTNKLILPTCVTEDSTSLIPGGKFRTHRWWCGCPTSCWGNLGYQCLSKEHLAVNRKRHRGTSNPAWPGLFSESQPLKAPLGTEPWTLCVRCKRDYHDTVEELVSSGGAVSVWNPTLNNRGVILPHFHCDL